MAQAAGAIIGISASLFSMSQQSKALDAQKRAMKEQKNLQRAADARERRQLLRQQAIARGQTVNVAAQIGGMGGTGLSGGLAGLENQVASSIGFQETTRLSMNRQQRFLDRASQYQTRASIGQGVAGAAGDIASIGSGLGQTALGLSGVTNPMQSTGFGMRYV